MGSSPSSLSSSTECHPGSQGRQGAEPKCYTEQGSETPSAASCTPPRHDIQCGFSCTALPSRMEARPHYLHPETWEGPGATLVVSSHKSCQVV